MDHDKYSYVDEKKEQTELPKKLSDLNETTPLRSFMQIVRSSLFVHFGL